MKRSAFSALSAACLCALFLFTGCGPALVGTAGVGAYKGAPDERTVGTMIDDSVTATRVKTKLASDDLVKARHIDVDCVNTVVYLSGVVRTDSQRRMAGDIARSVPHVSRVENQLVIGDKTMGDSVDDLILLSRIKTNLIKEPGVRSLNVDIDVHNGTVTLNGMTGSPTEKQKVLSVVRSTSPDSAIVDNLQVKRSD